MQIRLLKQGPTSPSKGPEYVHERGRHRHPVGHRKTHARGLPYVVIRILAENDHFHLVERAGIESREYTRSRRKHLPGCVFRPYEIRKASKTFRLPLRCQCALPRFFYFHIHLANIRKKPYFCRTYPAPIVQWIELRIPVPSIGVRLPTGVQQRGRQFAFLVFYKFKSVFVSWGM